MAVVGGLRLGYGGVLLRAGIPFDYLSDHEQCDLDCLRRYDLVLAAGFQRKAETWSADALRALDSYVLGGGHLLCELGSLPPDALGKVKRKHAGHKWDPEGTDRPFIINHGEHRFLQLLPPHALFEYGGTALRFEQLDDDTTVLGHFTKPPLEGIPAVLARRYDHGELVYLNGNLSYLQGNWAARYEPLIGACVEYLSGGAAKPQWDEPRGLPTPTLPPPTVDTPYPLVECTRDAGPAPAEGYAVRFRADPAEPVVMHLEWGGPERPAAGWLLQAADQRLTLTAAGSSRPALSVAVQPGEELVLQRLPDRLSILRRGAVVATVKGPLAPGLGCFLQAPSEPLFQPLGQLYQADDFTRTGQLTNPWAQHGGRWQLTGLGPPYRRVPELALRGWGGGVSLGDWFWSDYEAAVAARPTSAREVRLAVAQWDDQNRLELRLAVGRGHSRLVRVRDGRESTLAESNRRLLRDQWFRPALRCADGQAVATVDGEVWLSAKGVDAGAGGITLGSVGGETIFDDLLVHETRTPLPSPRIHPADYDKGDDGLLDRDTWSHPAAAWVPTRTPREFWHVGRFVDDFRLRVPLYPTGPNPRLEFLVGETRDRVARRLPVPLGLGPVAELRRRNGRCELVYGPLRLPVELPRSVCLGLHWEDLSLAPADLELTADAVREYVFDRAASDWWEAEGTWQVGSRWPCQPQWAWLTGTGTPQAVWWLKHRVTGDLSLQALLGVRMLGRYGHDDNEQFERLRVTICGNGRDPWRGYTMELGATDDGLSRLYRRHKVVATSTRRLPPWREVHNFWGDLRIDRHGSRLTVWFQSRPLLEYDDPNPLPDGQIALWTEQNAIVTPYLAVYGQQAETVRQPGKQQLRERWWQRQREHLRIGAKPLPAGLALSRLLDGLRR